MTEHSRRPGADEPPPETRGYVAEATKVAVELLDCLAADGRIGDIQALGDMLRCMCGLAYRGELYVSPLLAGPAFWVKDDNGIIAPPWLRVVAAEPPAEHSTEAG